MSETSTNRIAREATVAALLTVGSVATFGRDLMVGRLLSPSEAVTYLAAIAVVGEDEDEAVGPAPVVEIRGAGDDEERDDDEGIEDEFADGSGAGQPIRAAFPGDSPCARF